MYKRILTVRERENYVSKKIHIENFRLLMDYDVDFDEELTLFVGKNNAGKTSLMNLMDMVVSGSNLVLMIILFNAVRTSIMHSLIFGAAGFHLRIV